MAEGVTCRPPLPGNWRPLEAARGPARGFQGMRLISGEVERRTPRSAKQKRERRQLLWLKGKRIPGGRKILATSHLSFAFPARPERPPSCPSGQFEHSKRRWETMRRWCWKEKNSPPSSHCLTMGSIPLPRPHLLVAQQRNGPAIKARRCRLKGTQSRAPTTVMPDKCSKAARRSGIHPVTHRNCTESACGTAMVWIPHQVRDDG